jgi:transcription antitermination factor NusG
MPILKRENDIFPADLLSNEILLGDPSRKWTCVYTLSRREKDLMRKLAAWKIPFYAPIIPKRYRSNAGRLRTSFIPLFPNYVFMLASEEERYRAMTTNTISKCTPVKESERLVHDLRQISEIIQAEVPLTPESLLEAGNQCRIKTGPFQGYEGIVVRRDGKTRFLVSVQFLEQAVSMEIDEGLLEPL